MWTSTEIRESLSDSTKLWVTVSSLSNTVRRWTSKRERDRHNEWRGFQKLFQLWIVRWQDWQEINLWMPSRIRWLKWRVQWLFQGLLAWWKRDSTPQRTWHISVLLLSWKVVRGEPQIQSGLWRSMILIEHWWIRMSLFSITWKMDQSVVSPEKSFRLFLLELSCLLKEFINLKTPRKKWVSSYPQAILGINSRNWWRCEQSKDHQSCQSNWPPRHSDQD